MPTEQEARLRTMLYYLLTAIMDQDLAHIEGGAERLDRLAWEIARQCAEQDPHLPEHLSMYLSP